MPEGFDQLFRVVLLASQLRTKGYGMKSRILYLYISRLYEERSAEQIRFL